MTHVIHVSYVLTADLLNAANEAHRGHMLRTPYRWAMNGMMSLLIMIGLVALITGPVVFGLAVITIGGLWFFGPMIRRSNVNRHFRTRTDQDVKVEWFIDEEGVTIRTPNADSSCRWSNYTKFIENREIYLLYMNNKMFHVAPKVAFAPEDLDEFAQIVRSKIGSGPSKKIAAPDPVV